MALEGQPPWHTGNKQGYILLDEKHGFAITFQVVRGDHAPRIILAEWVRYQRDAESDDYYWKVMEGLKAVGLTFDQLAKLNQIVFGGVT